MSETLIKWRVMRLGNTYTVSPATIAHDRGLRLGRDSDTESDALERAERAAIKHARKAGGGRKGQWVVRRNGDQFIVEEGLMNKKEMQEHIGSLERINVSLAEYMKFERATWRDKVVALEAKIDAVPGYVEYRLEYDHVSSGTPMTLDEWYATRQGE